MLYLQAFKRHHITLEAEWSEALELEFKDCLRAVRRGLGPPKQAEAFDLAKIGNLSDIQELTIYKPGHPCQVRDTILVASWWLLREIEVAAAFTSQLTFVPPIGAS